MWPESHTSEEELLGSKEETVFCLGIGHRVESPHAHDLSDGIATAVVGV